MLNRKKRPPGPASDIWESYSVYRLQSVESVTEINLNAELPIFEWPAEGVLTGEERAREKSSPLAPR